MLKKSSGNSVTIESAMIFQTLYRKKEIKNNNFDMILGANIDHTCTKMYLNGRVVA